MSFKCEGFRCYKDAEIIKRDQNQNPHHYCSTSCVPTDLNKKELPMQSEPMAKSISEERSVMSPSISSSEPTIRNEREIQNGRLTHREIQRQDTAPTLPSLQNKQKKEEPSMVNELQHENDTVRLRDHSTELSLITEAEEYRQESLIEESIRSTHKLAKHVMQAAMDSKEINPNTINAACNAVKQMHSLIKLRLDIHRALKAK